MSAAASGRPVACAYARTKRMFPAEVASCACAHISGLASTPITSSARSAHGLVERPVPLPRSTTSFGRSVCASRHKRSKRAEGGEGRFASKPSAKPLCSYPEDRRSCSLHRSISSRESSVTTASESRMTRRDRCRISCPSPLSAPRVSRSRSPTGDLVRVPLRVPLHAWCRRPRSVQGVPQRPARGRRRAPADRPLGALDPELRHVVRTAPRRRRR